MELGIIISVYNESAAIASVLSKWRKELDCLQIDYRIYAYNDGSKDDSLEILHAQEKDFAGRLVVVDKPNSGHGPTILQGYKCAIKDGCEWIFQVDSDDEISPSYFSQLWEMRHNNDFVVGHRVHGPRSLMRRVVSFVSRLAVRLFYGKGIYDVNVPYRLMRVSEFSMIIESLPNSLFAPNVVIAGMAARSGLRFHEIPVDVNYRATGVCSLNHKKLIVAAIRSFAQTVLCAFRGRRFVFITSTIAVLMGLFCTGTNPFSKAMRGADEAVFAYIGQAMHRGLLPYKDVFDHKGLVLYFLNWLGLSISGGDIWGIWIIECSLLLMGCVLLMRLGERVFHKASSRLAIFPYLILIFSSTYSTNICEGYSIFFIVVAMTFLYQGIKNPFNSFVFGLCLAAIILMKFVTVAIAFVWGYLLLSELFRKQYRSVFKSSLFGILGFVIGVIPFIGYLYINGIVNDFWDVYVKFNLSYGKNCTVNSTYDFFGRTTIPILIALGLNLLAIVKGRDKHLKRVMILNLVLLFFSVALVLAVNARWTYYYLPIYPACFLPYCYGLVLLFECSKVKDWFKYFIACAGLGAMLFLGVRAVVYITHYAELVFHGVDVVDVVKNMSRHSYDEILPFRNYIKEPASVTVIGNNCQVYHTLKVTTPWKYPYQQPICWSSKEIDEYIRNALNKRTSRYIIVNELDKFRRYIELIDQNYVAIARARSYLLYERREVIHE